VSYVEGGLGRIRGGRIKLVLWVNESEESGGCEPAVEGKESVVRGSSLGYMGNRKKVIEASKK